MTLESYTASLPRYKQFKVAVKLARLALPLWEKYANTNSLSYIDSVVGMSHTVDKQLLKNSIDGVEAYIESGYLKKLIDGKNEIAKFQNDFVDPIVALQDMDWELPEEVKKVFYSVYNLLEAAMGADQTIFDESTIYVSINQAADALASSKMMTFDEINTLLAEMKKE